MNLWYYWCTLHYDYIYCRKCQGDHVALCLQSAWCIG